MSHGEDGTQFGYEDHFTPARSARKKKRKNRPHPAPPSPAVLLDRVSEELAEGAWLRATQTSLRESLDEAFPASDAAPAVLCLGLGSPAASRDARAQLAFLLAACDDLSIDRANVSAYDPVFAAEDLQLLAQLGVAPLPENRRASYGLRGPTIAFMPHCDLDLYENVLRENWSRARLPNVLLIANRLREYADSIPSRKLAAEHPCVARLVPHLTTRPLQPCAAFPTAFNNTAIQHVAPARLAARDADWWTLPQPGPGAPRGRLELELEASSITDAARAPADAVAAAETPAGILATATASTGATTATTTRTTTRSNAAAGEGAAAGEARAQARAGDTGQGNDAGVGVGNGNVATTATGRAESSSSLASSAAPLPSPSRPGSRPGPRGSTGPSPGAGARDGEWTGGRARADAGVASPDAD